MIDPNLIGAIIVGLGSFIVIRLSLWYFTERKVSVNKDAQRSRS